MKLCPDPQLPSNRAADSNLQGSIPGAGMCFASGQMLEIGAFWPVSPAFCSILEPQACVVAGLPGSGWPLLVSGPEGPRGLLRACLGGRRLCRRPPPRLQADCWTPGWWGAGSGWRCGPLLRPWLGCAGPALHCGPGFSVLVLTPTPARRDHLSVTG